ncbi:MAG: cytochrome P450 [Anaerolineae bacterium]
MTTLTSQLQLKHPLNLSSDFYNNQTHEIFQWMRAEAPVYKAKLTRWKTVYLISRYADVEAALKDPRFVKDINNIKGKSRWGGGNFWVPKAFRPLLHNMLNSDEPDHRRLRNLVHKAFTPKRVLELEPKIEEIAQRLIQSAKKKGSFDLIEEFAQPLPIAVIAHMLGIPNDDLPEFTANAEGFLVTPTPINMLRAVPAITRFTKYIRELAAKRQASPQDDLISALVEAEEDGDRFSEDELIGMVFLLFVAGHETTVNLIANGTKALLDHPDQFDLLKQHPEYVDSAVEEFLRFDGPLETTEMSFAREDISLHGVTIPKGMTVLPALLSANRDETVFENPDQLDILRMPNKHLSFGKGIHFCLGAPLARLESKKAFCTLLQEMPNLEYAVPAEQVRFRNMPMLHRLEELPVKI